MPGLFFGLEIARRALTAQQEAMDVTAHNVANANTPGYSRQLPRLATTPSWPGSGGEATAGGGRQFGTGVEVAAIQRARDEFLDRQTWFETQQAGRWAARRDGLEQVELIFDEPSERGLENALGGLWAAFQDLAGNAADGAVRATVLQQAELVAAGFRRVAGELRELRGHLDSTLRLEVNEVNSLAQEIARLNREIYRLQSTGQAPNDLLDKQDLALAQLARLVDVRVERDPATGMVAVRIGGGVLVYRDQAREIVAQDRMDGFADLKWAGSTQAVTVASGRLAGLIEMRDVDLPQLMGRLDGLAVAFANRMNQVHAAGYGLDGVTGRDLFSGAGGGSVTGAADLQVDPDVAGNPEALAAATSNSTLPGDGENALRLAGVFSEPLIGSFTVGEEYRAMIGDLGVTTREAATELQREEAVIAHLQRRQEEVAGVSLDEEMTNLLLFQHGYGAAARVVTTIDEMLDTIINRMGRTGR